MDAAGNIASQTRSVVVERPGGAGEPGENNTANDTTGAGNVTGDEEDGGSRNLYIGIGIVAVTIIAVGAGMHLSRKRGGAGKEPPAQ